MKTYALPETLRNDLLTYLMSRPCGEVLQGVIALQTLEVFEPVADASTEKPRSDMMGRKAAQETREQMVKDEMARKAREAEATQDGSPPSAEEPSQPADQG